MANKIIRRHTTRNNDGKGLRRMVAGKRFRLPADIDSREADRRFGWIEELWLDNEAFCRKIGREIIWTDIALWAAELFRKGERRLGKARCPDVFVAPVGGNPQWNNHPAVFPESLADQLIQTFSAENDLVVDPFVGSGTTCVSAKKLGRDFRGFDLNGNYLKLALKRLSGVTSKSQEEQDA